MIVAPPGNTPVTTPEDEPTDANEGALLVHKPPATPSVNVVVAPWHTVDAPVMELGAAVTDTILVTLQLPPRVYVIIAVPGDTADTMPDAIPIVATEGFALIHVPPVETSPRVVVVPVQMTDVPPVMGEGVAKTVTTLVALQPVPSEYVIVAVPVETPVTTPEEPTVAILVAELLQTPPPTAFVNVVVAPAHMLAVPRIGAGEGFTVTTVVTLHKEAVMVYVIVGVPAETP